jgi:hypothetical protein
MRKSLTSHIETANNPSRENEDCLFRARLRMVFETSDGEGSPTGLVTGSTAASGICMKECVEKPQFAPVWILPISQISAVRGPQLLRGFQVLPTLSQTRENERWIVFDLD